MENFHIDLDSGASIQSIFPVPIFKKNIGRVFTDKEKTIMDPSSWQLIPSSENQRAQNTKILEIPSLFNIKQFIESSLEEFKANVVQPMTSMNFKFTQSWINYSKKGDSHHKHFHANSIVSGVFYFKVEPQDPIYFYDRIKTNLHILNYPNYWNVSRMLVPVSAGDVIIFPSWLEHDVEPVKTDDLRVSLSFNTWFNGAIGSDEALTALRS